MTRVSQGGRRADLDGMYFRSSWEANYARYLRWLQENGEIRRWEYEPRVFTFPVKRGNTEYRPDFLVVENSGAYAWHEVKGYMDKDSATKLKRMAKYYPDEPVIVIDKDAYRAVARQVSRLIEGWEGE